jgi:hypothetical protein
MSKGSRSKKLLILSTSLAVTGIAAVAANPAQAAASSNADQLVTKAEKLAQALKKDTTYDHHKAVGYLNMPLFNQTKAAIKAADDAVKHTTGKHKKILETKLSQNVKVTFDRAARYIDAVNAGKRIIQKSSVLDSKLKQGVIDDSTIAYYYDLSSDIIKSSPLFVKVYDKATRDALSAAYLNKATDMKNKALYPVAIKFELDRLNASTDKQDVDQIAYHVDRIDKYFVDGKLDSKSKIFLTLNNKYKDSATKYSKIVTVLKSDSKDASKPTLFGGTAQAVQKFEGPVILVAGDSQQIKLSNAEVNGDVIIKGNYTGAGSVYLDNVKVNKVNNKGGAIVVDDVANHSLHQTNVTADELRVNDANGSNIVAEAGTKIKSLVVTEKAGATGGISLESKDKGAYGTVELASKNSKNSEGVTLKGDFSESKVSVTGEGTSLKVAKDATLKELDVKTEAKVQAETGANIQTVNLAAEKKGQAINLEGDFKNAVVTIANANANIKVAENTEIKEVNKDSSVKDDVKIDNGGKIDTSTGVVVTNNPPVVNNPTPPPVTNNPTPTSTTQFTSATNSGTANDVATLGLVGTNASSSAAGVATAAIVNGQVAITSVSAGTATITVTEGTNNATIAVTVAANGSITIGTITPYKVTFTSATNSGTANDLATLGLVGTSVSSSADGVATAAINAGKIDITSVAPGTATITVTDRTNNATIDVKVAANGSISISSIAKYVSYTTTFNVTDGSNLVTGATIVVKDQAGQVVAAESDGSYKLTAGNYTYTVDSAGYTQATGTLTVVDKALTENVTLTQIVTEETITVAEDDKSFVVADQKVATAQLDTQDPTMLVVTAVAQGATTLTVTHTDGSTNIYKVFVDTSGNIIVAQQIETITVAADDKSFVVADQKVATAQLDTQDPTKLVVTAVAQGTTTLTVTHADGFTTVYDVSVDASGNITVDQQIVTAVGVTVAASDTFAVADQKVATAQLDTQDPTMLVVTAVAQGTTTLTVTHADGSANIYQVFVDISGNIIVAQQIETITVVADDKSFVVADQKVATAQLDTQDPTKLVVTAVAQGTTTLTVTHADGFTTVYDVSVDASGNITVDQQIVTAVGVTVAAGDTFAVADQKVATAQLDTQDPTMLVVTEVAQGTTTLTVTHADGSTNIYQVFVDISGNIIVAQQIETITVVADDKSFVVADQKVATAQLDTQDPTKLVVTAVAQGTTTLTVTHADGFTNVYDVTVDASGSIMVDQLAMIGLPIAVDDTFVVADPKVATAALDTTSLSKLDVTAGVQGTTTLTVTHADGFTNVYDVTVDASGSIMVDQLAMIGLPIAVDDTFVVADPKVATAALDTTNLSKLDVTAGVQGTTTLTVTHADGFTNVYDVTVDASGNITVNN